MIQCKSCKDRTGLTICLIAVLIVERQSPPPIISPVHWHVTVTCITPQSDRFISGSSQTPWNKSRNGSHLEASGYTYRGDKKGVCEIPQSRSVLSMVSWTSRHSRFVAGAFVANPGIYLARRRDHQAWNGCVRFFGGIGILRQPTK